MTGGYEAYDVSAVPDAASAIQRAAVSAGCLPDLIESLGNLIGKNGRPKGDPDDAKASAMAVFVMSQRLAVESYTAVRLIGSTVGKPA